MIESSDAPDARSPMRRTHAPLSAETSPVEPMTEQCGRVASLSVDLDNLWAYLKALGNPTWQTYPSYFELVVPQMLNLLKDRGLRITFFVVGRDAQFGHNRDALAAIAASGHEIGNHSLRHDIWLSQYEEQELDAELAESERRLEETTGQHPCGFRGPGFSLSETTVRVLIRRGYTYDASALPSFLGPVARAYYLATTRLERAERAKVTQLFGGWSEGLRPLKPYQWRVGESVLIEIPVTTFPIFRFPIHFSYVMYLAEISHRLARLYLKSALMLCRFSQIEPSILLHPLDFLGGDDLPGLSSFPGMRLDRLKKRAVLEVCLDCLQTNWSVVALREHAAIAAARGDLSSVQWASRQR